MMVIGDFQKLFSSMFSTFLNNSFVDVRFYHRQDGVFHPPKDKEHPSKTWVQLPQQAENKNTHKGAF
jgi:hypothetical protein